MASVATAPRVVSITDQIRVGPGEPLLLISGPCQLESLEHALMIGTHLQSVTKKLGINFVFKASYDKANRTSINGKRGLGMERGLEILATVRKTLGVPVLSDIHSPEEAEAAGKVCDILQTPAFLCRQTDLLIAAGKTGKTIHVKKGQFLAPEDMAHVAAKVSSTGNQNILLCERGTCFGYRDLIVDMRGLLTMRATGYPVIFDGTHSVQSMGGQGGSSGGNRALVPPLTRAAVAVGVNGLFLECHQAPDTAPSDGPSMLRLEEVEPLLKCCLGIRAAAG